MQEYMWKKGAADFVKHDAQVIGEEMQRLRDEHGGEISPDVIVQNARAKSSPLHPLFPWDDKEAARRAREYIALSLVRSLHTRIIRVNQPPIVTRAFVSTKMKDKGRHFTGVEDALADEEGRAYLIRQAWLALKSWRRRYAELSELAAIFDAIDQEMARKAG